MKTIILSIDFGAFEFSVSEEKIMNEYLEDPGSFIEFIEKGIKCLLDTNDELVKVKLNQLKKFLDSKNLLTKTMETDFITHENRSDWGFSNLVMKNDGKAFSRSYWFEDDNDSIYFDWLSVDEDERKKGIASTLLKMHFEFARDNKFKQSFLSVKEDSWMSEWYKRKGYQYFRDNNDAKGEIWMKKVL